MNNKMLMRDLIIDVVSEVTGHFQDLEHSINIQQNYCNLQMVLLQRSTDR